jgi:hypothetical protein
MIILMLKLDYVGRGVARKLLRGDKTGDPRAELRPQKPETYTECITVI